MAVLPTLLTRKIASAAMLKISIITSTTIIKVSNMCSDARKKA